MVISEYKRRKPDSMLFFDENYKGEYPKLEITAEDLGRMYPKA